MISYIQFILMERLLMKWEKAPLYAGLEKFIRQNIARFHVPGHKGAHFLADIARGRFTSIMEIDLTELTGLDDLAHPAGMIAEAESLAAACFHSEKTFFLVGGSTVGNMAMIMATLARGDQAIVQRNSHKSIYHALAMVGADVISIGPKYEEKFQIPVGLDIEGIRAALDSYPQLKAIILTNPNYYGITSALEEIIRFAHEHHLLVLVDEAHGAHLGISPQLPLSAMQMGADCSVQSTHKMLGSMTMTSMLHVQGDRLNQKDIAMYLNMLQSSSPSYPLLASLDIAREHIQSITEQEWSSSLEEYAQLREKIAALGAYQMLSAPDLAGTGDQIDPYKLVIQPSWAMTGYQLQDYLEKEGIYMELAAPLHVVLTLPIIPQSSWNERLVRALQEIANHQGEEIEQKSYPKRLRQQYDSHLSGALFGRETRDKYVSMRVYKDHEQEEVALEEAINRRVAEMIIPYPPGVPLLLPGEKISKADLEKIIYLRESGAYFQGKKNQFGTIQVLK